MDPASALGIIGVIGQIVKSIYVYGNGVAAYKTEVAQLRSELFGLQAVFVQIDADYKSNVAPDAPPSYTVATNPFLSPALLSPETGEMLRETESTLKQLASTLDQGTSKLNKIAKQLIWPLRKDDVLSLVNHLSRLRGYFTLASTVDNLHLTKELADSIRGLHLSMQGLQDAEDQRTLDGNVKEWLTRYDPSTAYETARARRLDDTGSWFLDGRFASWLASDSKLLWLRGKPGSGKTCMTAAAIQRACKVAPRTIVAYFYCSLNNAESQKAESILGSLLSQICATGPILRSTVLKAYREQQEAFGPAATSADLTKILEMFQECCAAAQHDIVLFIDAVNECCETTSEAIAAIYDVIDVNPRVRAMITSTESSTDLPDETKGKVAKGFDEVNMDMKSVEEDIRTFVEVRVKKEKKLNSLRPEIQARVKTAIYSKSSGSFRWVQCALDGLIRQSTPKAMIAALEEIPSTLEEVYLSILKTIPDESVDSAQTSLELLVAAASPLTVAELAEAAVFNGSEDFDPDFDRLIEPDVIVRQLRSLVHINPISSRVELAHSSVRDFLTSKRRSSQRYYVDARAASDMMTRLCVRYLTMGAFDHMCESRRDARHRLADWPFYYYAAHLWSRHARHSESRCLDDIMRFLATADFPEGGNFSAWYQCVFPWGTPTVWKTKPLYTCAREGLAETMRAILSTEKGRAQLEAPGGSRASTPLHVAATYGKVETVRMLLAAGADPNERNGAGEAGIQWAQRYKNFECVRLMLEAGADPKLLKGGVSDPSSPFVAWLAGQNHAHATLETLSVDKKTDS